MSGASRETIREVLLSARELLVSEGWTQGIGEDHDGHRCLIGAVAVAAGRHGCLSDYDPLSAAMSAKYDALDSIRAQLEREGRERSIVVYNDADGRTVGEVLALIDRTIAALDAG